MLELLLTLSWQLKTFLFNFQDFFEMRITVASGQKRVPSIHVLQFADDNGELCFLLVHKEASKAKGEHDPNFPSSVLLAFLLQTSSASCFQWCVCVPHAALVRRRFPYMFEFRQGTLLCRVIYYPSLPVSIPIWEPCEAAALCYCIQLDRGSQLRP